MVAIDVVRAYVSDVLASAERLKAALGADDLLAAVMRNQFPRCGRAASFEYEFHGFGCLVTAPDGSTIDFEFGHRGAVGGFDAWRLWLYARDRRLPDFASEADAERHLAELEAAGLVRKGIDPLRPSLYYLASEKQ